jgi:hypothetical protein
MLNNYYLWNHQINDIKHGGTKATRDSNKIFLELGAKSLETSFKKNILLSTVNLVKIILLILFNNKSKFILQLPQYGRVNRYVAMLILKYFDCTVLLHDIDEIRNTTSNNTSSNLVLLANQIISTGKLLDVLGGELKNKKIVTLKYWDYLLDTNFSAPKCDFYGKILYAGNLKPSKVPDIYKSTGRPELILYGINYEQTINQNKNDKFMGSFNPDSPNFNETISFGLIWEGVVDGGVRYEGFNQPHKMSLYLAFGIPLIVWSKSCYSERVIAENIGFAVENLSEISDVITKLTINDYKNMKSNAEKLGDKIRLGYFLKSALTELIS